MDRKWWKEGVVYQIYPRSFKDSNSDGIGDLRGIIEKLDYLKELGIDIIWLNPVYKSPNDDNGYDISDYHDIMTEFGTLEDFEELLEEMHKRSIKLVMDLVINHTSDEHPWFIESRKGKSSKYRDYYIWHKGKAGNPPNNWGSFFGGSAWELDKESNEYYLHMFSKKMPDLNWESTALRSEIYKMMKWWLDKGVDGFRLDAIAHLGKDRAFPEAELMESGYGRFDKFVSNLPVTHEYLKEMNKEVFSQYDMMTVGETGGGVTEEGAKLYVAKDREELDMVFHFDFWGVDEGKGKWERKPWKIEDIKSITNRWQKAFNDEKYGWNSLYLNNHDTARMVSRFCDEEHFRVEGAKMLATFVHTQKGTPYIYQGEEIGMTNVKFDSLEDYDDVIVKNIYIDLVQSGVLTEEEYLERVRYFSRVNVRTPMQWNDRENAGFTSGKPWLKVNPNYKEINVEKALEDTNSVFYYYKKLIKLRKEDLVFVYGEYKELLHDDKEIVAYLRELNGEKLLVILNFFDKNPVFKLPGDITYREKELLISNYEVNDDKIDTINLKPYEARVYKLV